MKTLKGMPQTAWVTWVFLAGKIRRLKLWHTAKGEREMGNAKTKQNC